MPNKVIIAFLFFLTFLSCEFQKSIDINIPEYEPKLALNAYLGAGGHSIISLTQSIGVFDTAATPLSHPVCKIFEDGELLKELTIYHEDGTFYLPTDLAFTIGRTYYIIASDDEHPIIQTQEIQIPPIVLMEDAMVRDTIDENLIITATFKDPANVDNYYILKVDKYVQGQLVQESAPEPFFDPSQTFFSDEIFDGETHQLNMELYNRAYYMGESFPIEELHLILVSLSESTYNYINSSNNFESTSSDPEVESYPIFSNVMNGYGILGGFATDTIVLEF